MRTRILAVTLASVLLVAGAAGGAFAATESVHAQQATNNTTTTTTGGGLTTSTTTSTTTAETTTTESETATTVTSGPSITFEDQNSSGETVSVQSVTLPEDGFVVINGTPNGTEQVLGASYPLNAGTSDNIRVQLDRPIAGSQSLTAVLYADSNGNGQFDTGSAGGQADQPIFEGDSNSRVVDIAQVSAPADAGAQTQTQSAEGTATSTGTTAAGTATSGDADTTAAANGSGDGASNESNGSDGDGGSGAFGPGFGPVVAVIALLAIALFARRRN